MALGDHDLAVRREASTALVRLRAHTPRTRELLARSAEAETDPEQRRTALDAARQLRFQDLAESCAPVSAELIEALGAPDAARRAESARRLGQLGPVARAALPALLAALDDEAGGVRRGVVEALLAIRVLEESVELALERMVRSDPEPELRQLAASAERQLQYFVLAALRGLGEASAGRSTVLAVFDVRIAGKPHSFVDQLTDYLAARLASGGGFRVVPRDLLHRRLAAQKRASFRSCYDQSCQIELGKELAAQKVLATRVFRLAARCTITANLFDLRTEASERAATLQTGCSDAALLGGISDLVGQLSPLSPALRGVRAAR